ncbi:MAG: hypothetical protein WD607_00670 [Candidatus Paceibacterota bacterium]
MKFDLKDIFSVFSRRNVGDHRSISPELSDEFRSRLLLLLQHRFQSPRHGNLLNDMMEEVHSKFQLLLARGVLSKSHQKPFNRTEDLIKFLDSCDDHHFIDFIEYIFKSTSYSKIFHEKNEFVEEINQLLRLDDLQFHLTNFTFKTEKQKVQGTRGLGLREFTTISSYPKVILREDDLIHEHATEPALTLLENELFKNANLEFLDSLKDYKEGDYGDCLTKCGSSFESVMKIICKINGWVYKENDTASTLLDIIFDNSTLLSFYKNPLITIATIRNKHSKSHGAGTQERTATKNVAQFCINQTASSIVFLINELT